MTVWRTMRRQSSSLWLCVRPAPQASGLSTFPHSTFPHYLVLRFGLAARAASLNVIFFALGLPPTVRVT